MEDKIKIIFVDCRLQELQQEVSLPNCLQFEVFAASKASQIKQQIGKFMEHKDSVHLCLVGLDCDFELDEQTEATEETKNES